MPSAIAKVGSTVIADSDDTIKVEGNHYFPAASVQMNLLSPTDQTTVCHWKGDASYYTIKVDGEELENAAWTYHKPISERAEPIKDYVAFYGNLVDVEDK